MVDLIRVLRFLLRSSQEVRSYRTSVVLAVVASIVAGVASTALIAAINTLINAEDRYRWTYVAGFAGLCVLLPASRFLSSLLLVRLTQRTRLEIETQMSRRILGAPLRTLERVAPPRLLAALTEDVNTIVNALGLVPLLLMHLAVIGGCLIYLGVLSWSLLLGVLAVLALGVVAYQVPLKVGGRHFRRSRELSDEVYHGFRGLIEGVKELKLHRRRRQDFAGRQLNPALVDRAEHRGAAQITFALAGSWGQVLFFLVIGGVLFGAPRLGLADDAAVTGYTLAILYMLTPIDVVLNQLPSFHRAQVALKAIRDLGLSLEREAEYPDPLAGDPGELESDRRWESLVLRGVVHRYDGEGRERSFTLGPLDLEVHRGECLFLIGGNGSGKTTLGKLLLGLYPPDEGEILLDGEPVLADGFEGYRELFSAVFSDFFLFRTLLGLGRPELTRDAREYLVRLQLDEKVSVGEDGSLSTLELSQGQRKRLALLTAFLEDRSIYLFDEWAADQDPEFKDIFYRRILPALKARGKTTLVISHDDRYYSVADRIVKLESGRLVGYGGRSGPAEDLPGLPDTSTYPAGKAQPMKA